MSAAPTPDSVFGRRRGTPDGVQPPEPQELRPTPATVAGAPGVVCRIYVGGSLVYSTARLTLAEATEIADRVDQARIDRVGLIDFPAEHYERVRVTPEQIRSCVILRVDAFSRLDTFTATPGQRLRERAS